MPRFGARSACWTSSVPVWKWMTWRCRYLSATTGMDIQVGSVGFICSFVFRYQKWQNLRNFHQALWHPPFSKWPQSYWNMEKNNIFPNVVTFEFGKFSSLCFIIELTSHIINKVNIFIMIFGLGGRCTPSAIVWTFLVFILVVILSVLVLVGCCYKNVIRCWMEI